MRQAERLSFILERLATSGAVGVAELAAELDVSTASIRRDLQVLSDQRLLSRTHGGAIAHGVLYELPLRYRSSRNEPEKSQVASQAAERVTEGMSVGLTGGTTTTKVARAIADIRQLTVVTNSLSIASELAVRPDLKLVVTGGVARSSSYELVGPIADRSLADINLDLAIVGVDGIAADAGLTTHHEIEAQTNRVLIDRAAHVIVVADASKIGKVAFARICEIGRVDELITNESADKAAVAALAQAGLRVTTI